MEMTEQSFKEDGTFELNLKLVVIVRIRQMNYLIQSHRTTVSGGQIQTKMCSGIQESASWYENEACSQMITTMIANARLKIKGNLMIFLTVSNGKKLSDATAKEMSEVVTQKTTSKGEKQTCWAKCLQGPLTVFALL